MPKRTFILPRLLARDKAICNIVDALEDLPMAEGWRVEICPHKSTRSLAQNAYLWAVVYPYILEHGGEAIGGYRDTDLHEYFLGEMWGWEMIEGLGRKRLRPKRRSSKLSKTEFSNYIALIQEKMAPLGIVIRSMRYIGRSRDCQKLYFPYH